MHVGFLLPRLSSAVLSAQELARRAGDIALERALGGDAGSSSPPPPLLFRHADLCALSPLLAPGTTLRAWLTSAGARACLHPSPAPPPASAAAASRATAARTLGTMSAPEREAWREERRARAAHRDYASLVSGVTRREAAAAAADSFALVGQQFSVGFNILVSLATAAAVGYYLGRHFIDVNFKAGSWIAALACAVGLLLVEITLVVMRLSRVDAAGHARTAAARVEGEGRRAAPARQEEAAKEAVEAAAAAT